MNSHQHSVSASRKWGGTPDLYQPVNEFIDSSKRIIGDFRHRSLYHHTEGVYLCQRLFGDTIRVPRAKGPDKLIPVRLVAERHILEDLGWLPSPADYIKGMPFDPWMSGAQRKTVALSELLLNMSDGSDDSE